MALLLECSVDKPGNVGPDQKHRDTDYQDYLLSSLLLGRLGEQVASGEISPGTGVLRYVREIKHWTVGNPHLGASILLMPLARAVSHMGNGAEMDDADIPVCMERLHGSLMAVLEDMDSGEAERFCRAIKEMNPGGLRDPYFASASVEKLVAEIREGDMSYLEWMKRGAELDLLAREVVSGYRVSFDGAKWLVRWNRAGMRLRDLVFPLYVRLLSLNVDTFVAGKSGVENARALHEKARRIWETWYREDMEMDTRRLDTLRDHSRELWFFCAERDLNPGTTSDLVASSLFIAVVCGAW